MKKILYILPGITLILILFLVYKKKPSAVSLEIVKSENSTQNPAIVDPDDYFLNEAFLEAKKGLSEGGIPIGCVIVVDGKIIGRGHNRRVQFNSAIHHGEMNAFESTGRQMPEVYEKATLYTTLTPCEMCSGTILFYKIPRVVVGDNINDKVMRGGEESLRNYGVDVRIVNKPEIVEMFAEFKRSNPELWNEASAAPTCSGHGSQVKKKDTILGVENRNSIGSRKIFYMNKIENANGVLNFVLWTFLFMALFFISLKTYEYYRRSKISLSLQDNYFEL